MRTSGLALLAATGAAAQQITLQPCNSTFKPAVFTWVGNTPHDGNGLCLGAAGGGNGAAITAQACVPGSAAQSWVFNADGTVGTPAFPGQCFNVDGGGDSAGTPIVVWTCGEASPPRRVGAAGCHSFFAKQADGTILAKESGLCVSSAAVPPPPPPPPGVCASDMDCALNGKCVAGKCACYPPWTGTLGCEALAFAPSPLQRGFPAPGRNETSWGGSVVLDPVGKLYHMYVAEMMNECPLNT